MDFFMGLFDLIGNEILKLIEESRINGYIHSSLNSTFISLIPKRDNAQTLKDFRPISLCNNIYKVVSNIINRRLKYFLWKSVSQEQFIFLEGRQIHEAIGLAYEALHSIKSRRTKEAIFRIDLSISYDRVSCIFLRMLLTHLGFEIPFINWIMICISYVSFVFLIKGEISSFFSA